MTSQVSWRADEELIERAKRRARELNMSMNSYISHVVDVATNPDNATTEGQQLRERLAAAGLLAHTPPPEGPEPTPEVLAEAWAALRASEKHGPSIVEVISEGRGE